MLEADLETGASERDGNKSSDTTQARQSKKKIIKRFNFYITFFGLSITFSLLFQSFVIF